MDLEPIPGKLGIRQEYVRDGSSIGHTYGKFREAGPHFLGEGKPVNSVPVLNHSFIHLQSVIYYYSHPEKHL